MADNKTDLKKYLPSGKTVLRVFIFLVILGLAAGSYYGYKAYGRYKERINTLAEALTSNDPLERSNAAAELGMNSTAAQEAIPDLVDALKDHNWLVRFRAAEALGNIGVADKEAVAGLISLLKDPIPDVRQVSAESLGNIGMDSLEGVKALCHAAKDEDVLFRETVLNTLKKVFNQIKTLTLWEAEHETTPTAVPTPAAKVSKRRVRLATPTPVIIIKEPLPEGAKDKGVKVVKAVAVTKEDLNAAEAAKVKKAKAAERAQEVRLIADVFIEALQDKQLKTRLDAAVFLGTLGETFPGTPNVVPSLIKALQDKDYDVRFRSLDSLQKIATPAALDAVKHYRRK